MSLKETHDIGEELQKKIERIPEVERVFKENFSYYELKMLLFYLGICPSLIMNLIIKLVMSIKLSEK